MVEDSADSEDSSDLIEFPVMFYPYTMVKKKSTSADDEQKKHQSSNILILFLNIVFITTFRLII